MGVIKDDMTEKKKQSLLHQDVGPMLKKRYQLSLFNLVLILISLFIAAFFAGTQTAGVFQLGSRAMMKVGTQVVPGFRIQILSSPTPTLAEETVNGYDDSNKECHACGDGKYKQVAVCSQIHCDGDGEVKCSDVKGKGCTVGTTKDASQCIFSDRKCDTAITPTSTAPTPTVYIADTPGQNGTPAFTCDSYCSTKLSACGRFNCGSSRKAILFTQCGGRSDCEGRFQACESIDDPECPGGVPTTAPGVPSVTPGGPTTVPGQPTATTAPNAGACGNGFNLTNCTRTGGGCCTDWGVGTGCSQYDADRHFEYCQSKCGYGGNPNACGGGGGGNGGGGGGNAGKCGDPNTPNECCNKGNSGGGCVSKSQDCESGQVSFGQAGCGGGQICCGN